MRLSPGNRRWFFTLCRFIVLAALLVWTGGFFWFVNGLKQPLVLPPQPTQGIVVLTGGQGRIKAAVALLEAGLAQRLLISGVNQVVSPEELRRALDISAATYACCIDLGKSALNTEDNAIEAADWAWAHHYHSLRIVTALDHMPRSMVEFRRVMPGFDLVAHPILAGTTAGGDETSWPKLVLEYSKYTVSLLRAKIMPPPTAALRGKAINPA
jgi:uncharacterized SAM-binding protein YcdF (DUF218 family)